MPSYYPQLRYLGMIPHPDHSEYGFRVENEDKTVRLIVLNIATTVFLKRQLLIQEAPDLCYQKVLADLRAQASGPPESSVRVTESDIAHYRSYHPLLKSQRKSFRRIAE